MLLEEKICSFPHCPKKIRQKLSVCEAFSVANQNHSLAERCFYNVTLEKCRLDLPPSETSEKGVMVLTGAALRVSRVLCMGVGMFLSFPSPGWCFTGQVVLRMKIERLRKVSKTKCWKVLVPSGPQRMQLSCWTTLTCWVQRGTVEVVPLSSAPVPIHSKETVRLSGSPWGVAWCVNQCGPKAKRCHKYQNQVGQCHLLLPCRKPVMWSPLKSIFHGIWSHLKVGSLDELFQSFLLATD